MECRVPTLKEPHRIRGSGRQSSVSVVGPTILVLGDFGWIPTGALGSQQVVGQSREVLRRW